MAKSVCIVGAGPAGLVAAKNLLNGAPQGFFKVVIFEAQKDLGGLWPTSRDDTERQIHPLMFTNGSKHTVAFSDLCWEDEHISQFPRAYNVGQYLRRYHDRYLDGNPNFELRLNSRVIRTETSPDVSGPWSVSFRSSTGTNLEIFDYLIVASGFFGQPITPPCFERTKTTGIPVLHSCHYRDLKGLLGKGRAGGGKILVVGGQMSGVEIAGTIGTHLSSAINSPGEFEISDIDKYSIHNVVPRPTWVFPLFTSPEPTVAGAPFLPLDFGFFNRNNRGEILTNTQGHIDEENAEFMHGLYQYMLGGDQSEFSPEIQITEDSMTIQPHMSVSDWYCEFVRSGLITVSHGKVKAMEGDTAYISTGQGEISEIAAVVLATGFDPTPCLSFLPEAIRERLSHSPKHVNQPLALAFHGTHHPDIPNLGFVGFYRNPYWGVMEMHARYLTKLWSDPTSESLQRKRINDDSIQRTLSLRDDPRVSQYPMGDYPYLMQEFADALDLKMVSSDEPSGMPCLSHNDRPLDMFHPARYQDHSSGEIGAHDARLARDKVQDIIKCSLTTPKYVARGVFRSLLGTWDVKTLVQTMPPCQEDKSCIGSVQFLLRKQTTDGYQHLTNGHRVECDDDGLEYLCVEEHGLDQDRDSVCVSNARHVWRYDDLSDSLSVWSVGLDDPVRALSLSHRIEFEQPEEEIEREDGWLARAEHLKTPNVSVAYKFAFQAVNLMEWSITTLFKVDEKVITVQKIMTR
ncbi:hypothetical protein Asppvi_005925 [Aspergillus pseudoviridinutans]|uniref:FAD/NAD(P)-binding domain-containing protein n=1 Tax=Aspergillus pseudoviridinutans TaxID=1517512 RepID=A0A9P3EVG2_9EURO|nr:uncharacterized protein Asppvi_005925 [Aspergillus pseudoviridinutans]GIJ87023.1 hypothetical protein Asppvi_005925 [Aspergillus pseudoviridinutans]